MSRYFHVSLTFAMVAGIAIGMAAFAQQQPAAGEQKKAAKAPAVPRPPLFFREEWKQPPYTGTLTDAARRLTQDAVTSADLQLKIYGPCRESGVEVYGTPHDSIFPMNLWTGMCASPVAITLRDRNNFADLTGPARIRWTTRAANLHAVHPVLKLADGTMIVGDHADATPTGAGQTEPVMMESEFAIDAVHWFMLNPETIATTRPAGSPDLSKVDEVGFADLMPGGGHGSAGWINVGTIEVYGKPVKR